MKKLLFVTLTVAWLWASQQNWGSLPVLARFFTWPTSPLKIDNRFDQSEHFKSTPYGPVSVGFDSLGIPHIFAENDEAADYATGFVHARDRLFQMEMAVRVVKGQLCEVVGERALTSDLFWRKFRFDSLAVAWYKGMADSVPELAQRMEAYAAGVNRYISYLSPATLPIEFHLLDIQPTEWKKENMFFLLRFMSHTLNYNENDLAASAITSQLGTEIASFWYPNTTRSPHPIYPNFNITDSIMQALLPRVNEELDLVSGHSYPQARVVNLDDTPLGSNNWVVKGNQSASTYPLLCNDTHLETALPSTWYEIHKSVAGRVCRGLSIAGSPFVISGFNNNVAWGMTNATWDLVDFYSLEVNKEGTHYRLDGAWEPLIPFTVEIKVKGTKPVRKTFYHSHFGIADTLSGRYLAVNWIGQQPSNEGLTFHGFEKANSLAEAQAALQHYLQPPQNFVLADRKGHIGGVTAGGACIHPLPAKGVRKGRRRNQLIGFTRMQNYLNSVNPSSDYWHSANQEQVDHPLAAHISTRYESSGRGRRITALIDSLPPLDFDGMRKLHMDVVDMDYPILREILLAVSGPLRVYLEGWDGQMDTSLVAPTLLYSFKNQLRDRLIAHLGGGDQLPPLEQHIFTVVATDDSLPIASGKRIASLQLAQEAWDSSMIDLKSRLGIDPATWHYGRFHTTLVAHRLKLPALGIPEFASPGSNRTVNVASRLPSTHAASMRTIIEMRPDGPKAWLHLTGGQSGRFNSRNYADQVQTWLEGRYHNFRLLSTFKETDYVSTYRFSR
jgi:penicillin amidase